MQGHKDAGGRHDVALQADAQVPIWGACGRYEALPATKLVSMLFLVQDCQPATSTEQTPLRGQIWASELAGRDVADQVYRAKEGLEGKPSPAWEGVFWFTHLGECNEDVWKADDHILRAMNVLNKLSATLTCGCGRRSIAKGTAPDAQRSRKGGVEKCAER